MKKRLLHADNVEESEVCKRAGGSSSAVECLTGTLSSQSNLMGEGGRKGGVLLRAQHGQATGLRLQPHKNQTK